MKERVRRRVDRLQVVHERTSIRQVQIWCLTLKLDPLPDRNLPLNRAFNRLPGRDFSLTIF
jgi:hypothetical protein